MDKQNKSKGSSKKVLAIVLTVVVILGVIGTATVLLAPKIANKFKINYIQSPTVENTETHGVAISSPVGELFFPNDIKGTDVSYDLKEDADNSHLSVFGKYKDVEAELFTVYFGESDKGFLFGTAPNNAGNNVEIRIEMNEIDAEGLLDEDIRQTLFSMQDRVNDVIEQIYSLNGFEGV